MATMTSSSSGGTVTYTITDMGGNVLTVTAPPAPAVITYSGSSLQDGQDLLNSLNLMLRTGLRPTMAANATAFTS